MILSKFPAHWRYLKYSISKRNSGDQKSYVKLYNYFENNHGAPLRQCPHFSVASAACGCFIFRWKQLRFHKRMARIALLRFASRILQIKISPCNCTSSDTRVAIFTTTSSTSECLKCAIFVLNISRQISSLQAR